MSSSRPYKSMLKGAVSLLAALLGIFMISLSAFSQGSQGTIQGTVFDQTGGAVAGAAVTVLDVARGVTRTLTTDGAGEYVTPNVIPGTYTIRAAAKGFRTIEHTGVLVEVGQTIRVDLVVQPGEQTQTITVTGEVAAIDTTDATLGGTVSNAEILALPLNGRNFQRLLQLRPGVVTQPGAGAGDASTNGRRTGNDLLLVEGIAEIGPSNGTMTLNSVYRTGDSNSILPIDAIQEFNTQQDTKAEYGWRDGSVVNVAVKSGTNSIHGTAWAFGRDATATDANNFFTPGQPTPATVEQYGGRAHHKGQALLVFGLRGSAYYAD
jgi:Carboxypeptidase regulatory-like domain